MPDTPSTHEEKVRAFWARYAEKVLESCGKLPFDRWHVIRAEDYVAAYPGLQLADQTTVEVAVYPGGAWAPADGNGLAGASGGRCYPDTAGVGRGGLDP
jgi:hypothetical protein